MTVKRIWHGYTAPERADDYEAVLKAEVIKGIEGKKIPGFRRIEVLRRPLEGEVEFVTIMEFDTLDSVKGFVGLVDRSLEVEVSGLDENAAPQTWRVRGWPARILQHEVDHLAGTLYIDRMKTRSFATAEHAKALYGGKPIVEIRKLLGLE